jgi:hypothetical protein
LRGARQGHLDGDGAIAFEERKLVAGERAHLAELRSHDAGDTAEGSRFGLACLPRTRHGIGEIEAFDGVGEIAHEVAAAQFAVGGNFEAELFLFGEDAADVLIFELFQAIRIGSGVFARFEKFGGPQKTPDVIRSPFCGHGRAPLAVSPASHVLREIAAGRRKRRRKANR